MDGSHFGPSLAPDLAPGLTADKTTHDPAARVCEREREPGRERGREPLPEREWGLSARQVVVAVVVIVALCQVLGALHG